MYNRLVEQNNVYTRKIKLIDDIVTKELVQELYINNKFGLPKIKDILLDKFNINVSIGFLYNRLKRYQIDLRSSSEARQIWNNNGLDYQTTYLTTDIKEWIDGFLLGDGYLSINYSTKVARCCCGVQHEEFCRYLMSGLSAYDVSEPKFSPDNDPNSGSSGDFQSRTRFHPDLFKIAEKWYVDGKKINIPQDVIITPTSVMLWYLGDGTLTVNEDNNTASVRLSTDGFNPEEIEKNLVPKLLQIGIECHRNNDNRIRIDANGLLKFFEFIGNKSPVVCYNYKFNIPSWRLESKRASIVTKELGVSYNRLMYLIKSGKIPCFRASKNGRPRLLKEHILIAKEMQEKGILY